MEKQEKRRSINWPMVLTGFRLLMIPVFAEVFKTSVLYATLIIALAGITDLLDGYLARRLKMVTTWGALLDPLASFSRLTGVSTGQGRVSNLLNL